MNNQRIVYIDSLKGLAILLMVMGHVIAWQFQDWQVVLANGPRIALLVWHVIYSFHMPLFMFCSGLVALHIQEYKWRNVGGILWKRARALLFPFVSTGYLLYVVTQGNTLGYWFLWMLFQFIIVVMAIDGICSLIPKYGKAVSTFFIVAIAILVHFYHHKFFAYERLPLIDVGHWSLFPYFCMGVVCSRYNLCTKWLSKNWVYTLSIVVFAFLTYWITITGNRIPKQSITGCVLPISAIVTLVFLFREGLSGTSKLELWLQKIGRNSLEIYIIHFFFLFRMWPVGEFVIKHANPGGERTIFFVQLISSFVSSVIIIALCYIVMNVINKSQILSQVLLGRKSEK